MLASKNTCGREQCFCDGSCLSGDSPYQGGWYSPKKKEYIPYDPRDVGGFPKRPPFPKKERPNTP